MPCVYIFNKSKDHKVLDGQTYTEEAIDEHLKRNWSDAISLIGSQANMLFSYDRTVEDVLDDARTEARDAFQHAVSQALVQQANTEESVAYNDGFTSVTRWIENNGLFAGVDRAAYRAHTENTLFPTLTKAQRDEEYRKIYASWSYTRKIGRGFHYIAERLMHDRGHSTTITDLISAKDALSQAATVSGRPLTLDGVSEEAMKSFITGMNKVINDQIFNRGGKKITKYFIEFPVQAELGSDKIRGSVDIVTVDEDGKVVIYDIKLSATPVDQWDSDRKNYVNYQQELYRKLLESKGIKYTDISTKIIPVIFSLDNTNLQEVADDVINTASTPVINGVQVSEPINVTLDIKQRRTLNNLLPGNIAPIQTTPCIDEVNSNLNSYFHGAEVAVLPTNPVIKTTVDGKRYYIVDETTDNVIIRDTKEELQDYIDTDYATAKDENLADLTQNLYNSLGKVLDSMKGSHSPYVRLKLESVLNGYNSKEKVDYINTLFAKYTYETGWSIIQDPDLMALHVVMLVNSETKEVDLIGLENSNLFGEMKLSKGTTLLGSFYEDTNPNIEGRNDKLKATKGNYNIIKLLEIATAKLQSSGNSDYYIGYLTIYNPEHNQTLRPVVISNYIENFNLLRRKIGKEECKLQKIDELVRFAKAYNDIIKSPGVTSAIQKFGKDRVLGNDITLTKLHDLLKSFRNFFYYSGKDFKPDGSLESILYSEISMAIVRLSNISVDSFNSPALATWVGNFDRRFLNSLKLNTADTIELYEPIKQALNKTRYNIRARYTHYKNHARDPYIAFKKGSVSSNKFVNLSEVEYSKLVDNSEQGKKEFRFKDPETDATLTQNQKTFLIWYLNDINKLRFGDEAKTEEGIKRLKESGKWYWIPIMKAQTASRLVNHEGGLIKSLASNISDELINRRGVANEEELDSYKKVQDVEFTEFFNLFSDTSSTLDRRLQLVQEARTDVNGTIRDPLSVFEINLETVADTAHLADIRESEYNRILPTIQANLTMLELGSYISSREDVIKTIQYIKDNIKTTVLDMPLIGTEGKQLYKILFGLKKVTSALILGGNLRSGLKETATSFFRLYTRATANSLTDKTRIGLKDMMWAYGTVWKDAMHQITTLTKLEELNMFFGMANMSEEELVQRMNFYQSDPMRVMTNMFWACRAPDFLNRTTILVGYMKKYGCWDAYTEDKDGHYKYDWHKDKRFALFSKYNSKHDRNMDESKIPESDKKEYLYQKALYYTMLERFVQQDYRVYEINDSDEFKIITMDDDLPQAFTDVETASMKRESDALFGYMDNDNKSEIFKGGILAIIGHFKTYLTAIKDQWFVSRGSHFEGYWAQDTDGDGNKIYNQANDDGTFSRTTNERNTRGELNQPAISWHGRITEGIFWSLMDTCITPLFSIRNGECMKLFKKAWSDPVKQRNMLIGLQEGIIIGLLFWLLRLAFGGVKLGKINDSQRFLISYTHAVAADLNVVSTLGQGLQLNAPSWDFVSNVWQDMHDAIITRKLNPGRIIVDNLGITRPYRSYLDKYLPNPKYEHTALSDLR